MVEGNKIKLIQVIGDSKIGGGPKHVLSILKNIDQKLFDLYLICPPGYLSVEGKLLPGVKVFNAPFASKFDFYTFFKVKNYFEQIKSEGHPFAPMIIHTHGTRAGFLGRLFVPHGVKSVYTEHILDENFHLKNIINEKIQKKILARQNQNTDLIIAVSASVLDFIKEQNGVDPKKVVLIHNGIEIEKIKPEHKKSAVKTANRSPIIGTIGSLNIQKGQSYLIEAMHEIVKKYPLATLEIIGEGPEKDLLQSKLKFEKLEKNISLLGHKEDIYKHLKHWDVFVLPSISETFGIAILEAMLVGVPVVATRIGGITDIVTHRKDGLLVEAKSPANLSKAIIEILDHPSLGAKFKRSGEERVKEFDIKSIVKKIEKEYIRILEPESKSWERSR